MIPVGGPSHPLDGLLTVMWHYVRERSEAPHVGAMGVDPATFDRQLDLIARHRSVVDWPAVAAALAGGSTLPPAAALLTFDDGLADHARTVAPRLLERGWTGVFFVMARPAGERLTVGHAIHVLLAALGEQGLGAAVADALPPAEARRFAAARQRERESGVDPIDILKRPLQRDLLDTVEPILHELVERHLGPSGDVADALHLGDRDVARMRREGLTIGGHGRRHVWFDHEPQGRVAAEIHASAAFLLDEPPPWVFAYPYGAAAPTSDKGLETAAFAAAFHASPRIATGRFDLGRIDAEDPRFERIVSAADP
jgi:peptidoglycan/xylan/chitin deacetylase (PgdA/CDA1 family)